VDAKPSAFPQQPARVTQRYSNFLSFVIDAIDPAFPPHRRLFRSLGVVVSKEMLHVKIDSFQYPKDENERKREIHAKKKKTETNAPHALFAHRSWTTIRRENDAGVSRFFGDDASAFPFALMKEEERYKKNTPPQERGKRGGRIFEDFQKYSRERDT
tara:strand:+ start:1077 stop:1547 length:471 start_codon:yes stop_codon:yes gene_type:complete